MDNSNVNPNRPIWVKDIQVLLAITVVAITMAGGWTALHNRVSINERDILAEKNRLTREISISKDRAERLENYLIRIENKIDTLKNQQQREAQQTNLQFTQGPPASLSQAKQQ